MVVTSWYWDVQLVGRAPMLGVAALAFDLAVVVVVVGFTVVEVVEAWKAVSCEWASEMVAGAPRLCLAVVVVVAAVVGVVVVAVVFDDFDFDDFVVVVVVDSLVCSFSRVDTETYAGA